MLSFDDSPRRYARIGGWFYLAIILLGLFGEMFVRGTLVVHDPAATLRNIASAEGLWRAGLAGDLLMHVFDLPLIAILYLLLRPVDRLLALLATLLNLVQTAVLVANKLTMVAPLVAIEATRGAGGAADTAVIERVAWLAVSLHDYGFAIGLVFFGFACLVRGHLMARSGFFPRWLGVLLQLAGASYLVNSGALLLAPALAAALFPAILLPALVGELAFCLYLIFRGLDEARWAERLAASRG